MKVVISQPMFFPWIGIFEQIHLADVYLHLDDVQMPGSQSFMHRVQLKGPSGSFWWNAPIKRAQSLSKIKQVEFVGDERWISKSMKTLEQIFSGLPFKNDALGLFSEVVKKDFNLLSEFNIYALETISAYLGLKTQFKRLDRKNIEENKTLNLIHMLVPEKASVYISGKGGLNYIQNEIFDAHNISLKFMRYENTTYPQKFGDFDPYVSILHPIAALGKGARDLLVSGAYEEKQLSA